MSDPDCIVLAAGASSRMGEWKLMLPWRGSTVVEASVRAALLACGRVLLVTGHRGGELASLFAGEPRVVIVPNPAYQAGHFSSVQAGVRAVATPRFFIALADMPLVGPGLYRRLLEAPEAPVVRPVLDGIGGHPVLLSRLLVRSILAEPVESNMRKVLARFEASDVALDDPAAYEDLDEPADYLRLRGPTP